MNVLRRLYSHFRAPLPARLLAVALFGLTALTVALLPLAKATFATTGGEPPPLTSTPGAGHPGTAAPRIEVVFVLDTTGSMGGLIATAKEKIWSIATTMAAANHAPEIRMGLVAYRDRGDRYVTQVVDLSTDLDSVYAKLMDLQAEGGGDGPESVNEALHDAVHRISWSQDRAAYKTVFLVGDAPPHMDYPDDVKYPETLAVAKVKGIVVNTIQCGQLQATTGPWQRIAGLGDGRFFAVGQGGDAVAIATPFDEQLAALSAKLDLTRLYYGDEALKAAKREKQKATERLHAEASTASRARRATFNASASGRRNLLGEGELVSDVADGRVKLEDIPPAALPAPLARLAPAEQKAFIDKAARERAELEAQLKGLAAGRADFISRRIVERGGAAASLDHKLFETVREQAGKAGLRYESDALRY